jgi:hypothetical protein
MTTPLEIHLYLSLTPEALIASHLSPEEFGTYLAVGTQRRTSGQAIFFELDPAAMAGCPLPVQDLASKCRAHHDGGRRKSSYLGIYRIFEHVPMSAIGKLFLVTSDGRVLGLEQGALPPQGDRCFHLYQEFCPVNPRVVSSLDPREFCARFTDPKEAVSVPKVVFAEFMLGALAHDPEASDVGNLPYSDIAHLRDCLRELRGKPGKPTKVTVRAVKEDVHYRTLEGGFYAGTGTDLRFYPLPPLADLESVHHEWWRSALSSYGA